MKFKTLACPVSAPPIVNHNMRIACLTGHRVFEKLKETPLAPCWQKVNWANVSPRTGQTAGINLHSLSERPSGRRMLGWRTAAIALAIAIFAMCAGTPVFAGDTTVAVQRLGPPAVEARREALLQQMIASPSDLDLAFEYAQLSSQVGDYEGAISALERVLIYAPNTPRR